MDDSFDNLRNFVHDHDLLDRNSNIHFKAIVSIKTALNRIPNEEMEIRITFDDGRVSIQDSKSILDTDLYPTVFYAMWQKMEHVDEMYLHICDIHRSNAKIGKYDVKIIPNGRLKE